MKSLKSKILVWLAAGLAFSVAFGAVFANNKNFQTSSKHFQVDNGGTLTTGLVAYYTLDGNADDFWGNYNLTDVGGVSFASGKVHSGADHGTDNTSKRLEVRDNLGITDGAISVSLWIKFSSEFAGSGRYILVKSDSGTNVRYMLQYDGKGLHWLRERLGSGGTDLVYKTPLDTNWHHIVGTYDGINIALYVDNVFIEGSQDEGIGDQGGDDLFSTGTVGHDYFSNISYGVDGIYSEIGIWNRGLSQSEISDLYNGGLGQTMVDDSASSQPETNTASSTDQSIGDTTGSVSTSTDTNTSSTDVTASSTSGSTQVAPDLTVPTTTLQDTTTSSSTDSAATESISSSTTTTTTTTTTSTTSTTNTSSSASTASSTQTSSDTGGTSVSSTTTAGTQTATGSSSTTSTTTPHGATTSSTGIISP